MDLAREVDGVREHGRGDSRDTPQRRRADPHVVPHGLLHQRVGIPGTASLWTTENLSSGITRAGSLVWATRRRSAHPEPGAAGTHPATVRRSARRALRADRSRRRTRRTPNPPPGRSQTRGSDASVTVGGVRPRCIGSTGPYVDHRRRAAPTEGLHRGPADQAGSTGPREGLRRARRHADSPEEPGARSAVGLIRLTWFPRCGGAGLGPEA